VFHVDLDWTDSDSFESDESDRVVGAMDMAGFAADTFGLTHELIDPRGPGGGWPIIRFTGERDAIVKLLRYYFAGSSSDARHDDEYEQLIEVES